MISRVQKVLRRKRIESTMKRTSPVMLSTRVHLLRWYLMNEEAIRARAVAAIDAASKSALSNVNAPVFSYWNSGVDHSPVIVQRCVRSHQEFAGNNYQFLNSQNIADWVDVPTHIEKLHAAGSISHVHYSDILRGLLLQKHGGTWLDSTVLLTAPLHDWLPQQEIVIFERERDPLWVSSWFISSSRPSPLIATWNAALLEYWNHHDEAVDYYLKHLLFETVVETNPGLKSMWKSLPVHLSFWPPHELFFSLAKDYDEAEWQGFLAASPIHKLTHKASALNIDEANPNTYFSMLRDGKL